LTALSALGTANSLPNSVQPPTPMAGGAQMQQTGSKPNPWAQKAAAQSNAAPPHQSAADAEMPSSTWENPDDLPQPVGMVDTVRATAWRIASRVAMAAKARIDADERLTENRRLRSIEGETAEETDKARRQMWPPDAATIALFVVVLLGVGVLAGGIWIGMNFFGTKPYIAVGKKYLQDGRNDLAIVQFTAAIQKNAEDADALQLRAETYEKEKDYEHAAADFARLAELRPKMHAAARKAAFYQFKLKKYDDALKNCQRILATQPDDESIKAQLVMNLARSGKYEEAIAAGKKIDGELVPSYLVPDFLGSLAFAYTNAGDAQKAAGLYSKALKADPTNETNLAERAEAFMKAKDYKHAAADYIALTKLAPARAGGYADAAKAAFLGGDYETAAQQYEKANKFDPAAEYYLRLADSHMALGKFGHAVSDCDSALTLQPSSAEAKKLRAVALKKAQETKAIVTARITPEYADAKGTQMMPRDPKGATDPLTEMGYNALIQGDANRAIQFLSIAVKRTPNDNMAHRFLGNSLMQKERFREAFDQYSALSANNALLPSDELSYANRDARIEQLKSISVPCSAIRLTCRLASI
jgi:tetratricopeptide (TPR) repeat protein